MNRTKEIFQKNCASFSEKLGVGENLDAKEGTFILASRRCHFFYLEGFLNKQALERVAGPARHLPESSWDFCESALDFVQRHLMFSECVRVSFQDAILRVLSGFLVLIFEDYGEEFLAAEVRTTPQRSIQEPSKGKTLRGPHEGFCENIVTNLALLRRRIKSTDLCIREIVIGTQTQTRIALCYLAGVADMRIVEDTRKKLCRLNVPAVAMGEETVTELLFYKKGFSLLNPLPRARFTERPDTCAAELLEGKVVLLIDTTPNAVLLPMTLFEYFEECDNYYFPPATATYLRLVRALSIFISIFLVPIWLLAVNQSAYIPESLAFILVNDPYSVPLFLQLLLIELSIDGLKLASLNTPEPLANSLSVVGGLLLGDFAVKSGWFVPQAILYSAIVTILNFIPNNYELGYSLKFARVFLILLVQAFGNWGLVFGSLVLIVITASMRDAAGKGYLYPLIPFSPKGIAKIFVRTLKGKERQWH